MSTPVRHANIPYNDFKFNDIIQPDEFDANNAELQTVINLAVDQINVNTTTVVSANTKSDSAVATSNSANAKSDSAVATANSANTKADNAVATANTASTNATNALNKATQVETDYNIKKPQIDQAVIDANNAVASVASKVDLEYVNQVANNFQLGVVMPNSIVENQIHPDFKNKVNASASIVGTTPDYSVPVTSHNTLIPLSNEVAVGKLNYTLKGKTIANAVLNGNFKLGTSGWVVAGGNLSASNNNATVTGSGATNSMAVFLPVKTLAVGKKEYYKVFKFRVTNPNCTLLRMRLYAGTVDIDINNPVQNQWYTAHAVVTGNSTLASTPYIPISIESFYADASTANGKVMEVQEVMAIDLTDTGMESLTADQINERIPYYVDGVDSVNNLGLAVTGKNLEEVNYLTTPATAWTSAYGSRIKVIPNMPIYLKQNVVGSHRPIMKFYDKNRNAITSGITISSYSGAGFMTSGSEWVLGANVPSSNTLITVSSHPNIHEVEFGLYTGGQSVPPTATDRLVSQTATDYEVYVESVIYLPQPLRKLSGVYDELDGHGRYIKRVEKVVLDGNLGWLHSGDYAGFKSVYISDLKPTLNHNPLCIKYDGKVLSADKSTTEADSMSFNNAISGFFVISVADTDSGWGESYTPTANEIKAYFFGWEMGTWATSFTKGYNGTGTKAWRPIYDADTSARVVTSVPTTDTTPKTFGWKPYELLYQLATPVTEKLNTPPLTTFGAGRIMQERKRKYVLKAEDIILINTAGTNTNVAQTKSALFADSGQWSDNEDNKVFIKNMSETKSTFYTFDIASNIGKFATNTAEAIQFFLPKSIITLEQARQQLAGLEIEYETNVGLQAEIEYSYPKNIMATVAGHSEMINQVSNNLEGHLSEIISEQVFVTRDITVAGVQTVTGFSRLPKRLEIFGVVASSQKFCIGNRSSNVEGCITRFVDNTMNGGVSSIILGESSANFTSGNIVINADKSLTITWSKTGTGGLGTSALRIVAHYHGGD